MSEVKIAPCECGCGGNAGFWDRSRASQGIKKGDPKRYINGHSGRSPKPPEERFWENVKKADGCWEWRGAVDGGGYGKLWLPGNKMCSAHRFSYELHVGPIPKGMCVCHTCDNPKCANPAHLWLGTHADNAADRKRKGRNGNQQGENQANAKLTDADVREIRQLPGTSREVAERFGVEASTVRRVRRGISWTHIV